MKFKIGALLCGVAVLMMLGSSAAPPDEDNGHWKIVLSPIAARWTFLLDTRTGETWTMTETAEKKIVWEYVTRNPPDLVGMLGLDKDQPRK
jgi:hypothetical protein